VLSKTALALSFTLVAATAIARAADTPAPDTVQTALKGLYQLNCTAALDPNDKNFDAASATLAPDFVDVDAKGKSHSRDEVIAQGKQQLKVMHATACDNAFESVTSPDANTAVVITTMTMAGDLQAPDGKHQFNVTQKAQDTWKLVDGKWQESQSKELHVLVKIDGSVAQDEGE
jgi:hypothetical protein